jgi:hypothetical protein
MLTHFNSIQRRSPEAQLPAHSVQQQTHYWQQQLSGGVFTNGWTKKNLGLAFDRSSQLSS